MTCDPLSDTVGQWSPIAYSCSRTRYVLVNLYSKSCGFLVNECHLVTAIQTYCGSDPSVNSAPLLPPSGYVTQTVGSTATLVCPPSYLQVSTTLQVVCLAWTATTGVWSSATGACMRTPRSALVYNIPGRGVHPSGTRPTRHDA